MDGTIYVWCRKDQTTSCEENVAVDLYTLLLTGTQLFGHMKLYQYDSPLGNVYEKR
jgi:hypothetical protein